MPLHKLAVCRLDFSRSGAAGYSEHDDTDHHRWISSWGEWLKADRPAEPVDQPKH